MGYLIGVDLGGTFTKIGITEEDGKIVFSSTFLTKSNGEDIAKSIVDNIFELIEKNGIKFADIASIGVGCPGPVTNLDGLIENLTNLDVNNFDLGSAIKTNLKQRRVDNKLPVKFINDARAATLAEYILGAGKGYNNILLITLGTGVGGGIIINGQLYEGIGAAGEIGHMIIAYGGRKCGCGKRGCFEAYGSISALIKVADRLRKKYKNSTLNNYKKLNGKIIFDSYFAKDEAANVAVKDFINYLSIGITNLCNILRPEIIVIGGGVSLLGEPFIRLIRSECEILHYGQKTAPIPIITQAMLHNDAGIVGAALWGKQF